MAMQTCWDNLDFHYSEPNEELVSTFLHIVEQQFNKFCETVDLDSPRVDVNVRTLKEIIIRIDMRRLYYFIYHDKMKISEYKLITGLFIFWVLKLRPFWVSIREEDSDDTIRLATDINERFCVFIALSILKKYNASLFESDLHWLSKYVNELHYSFRYRDLSKESLYMMFDPFYYYSMYGLEK